MSGATATQAKANCYCQSNLCASAKVLKDAIPAAILGFYTGGSVYAVVNTTIQAGLSLTTAPVRCGKCTELGNQKEFVFQFNKNIISFFTYGINHVTTNGFGYASLSIVPEFFVKHLGPTLIYDAFVYLLPSKQNQPVSGIQAALSYAPVIPFASGLIKKFTGY